MKCITFTTPANVLNNFDILLSGQRSTTERTIRICFTDRVLHFAMNAGANVVKVIIDPAIVNNDNIWCTYFIDKTFATLESGETIKVSDIARVEAGPAANKRVGFVTIDERWACTKEIGFAFLDLFHRSLSNPVQMQITM